MFYNYNIQIDCTNPENKSCTNMGLTKHHTL